MAVPSRRRGVTLISNNPLRTLVQPAPGAQAGQVTPEARIPVPNAPPAQRPGVSRLPPDTHPMPPGVAMTGFMTEVPSLRVSIGQAKEAVAFVRTWIERASPSGQPHASDPAPGQAIDGVELVDTPDGVALDIYYPLEQARHLADLVCIETGLEFPKSVHPAYAEGHNAVTAAAVSAWDEESAGLLDGGWRAEHPVLLNLDAQQADFDAAALALAGDSFVIGEFHDDAGSAGEFLMSYAQLLLSKGFDTLYVEGLPFEAQGEIDAFLTDPGSLSRDAWLLMEGEAVYPCSNWGPVIALREAGMRIVGIDGHYADLAQAQDDPQEERVKAMNHFASRVIERDRRENELAAGKFVVLCGVDHARCSEAGTPGIAAAFGCCTVLVGKKKGAALIASQAGVEQALQRAQSSTGTGVALEGLPADLGPNCDVYLGRDWLAPAVQAQPVGPGSQ